MLQGILVDLIPYGNTFVNLSAKWDNGPAGYWATAGDRPLYSQAAVRRWHEEWRASLDKGPDTRLEFGIRTKDGTPIGQMGVNWLSGVHRHAELGASIGEPAYWGGGYGTDALLLLIEYLFEWLDLRRVMLGTMSCNARVLRQMEKVGFTLEARRRGLWYASGERYDEMVYGMLRDEWPGRAALVERLGLQPRPDPDATG